MHEHPSRNPVNPLSQISSISTVIQMGTTPGHTRGLLCRRGVGRPSPPGKGAGGAAAAQSSVTAGEGREAGDRAEAGQGSMSGQGGGEEGEGAPPPNQWRGPGDRSSTWHGRAVKICPPPQIGQRCILGTLLAKKKSQKKKNCRHKALEGKTLTLYPPPRVGSDPLGRLGGSRTPLRFRRGCGRAPQPPYTLLSNRGWGTGRRPGRCWTQGSWKAGWTALRWGTNQWSPW